MNIIAFIPARGGSKGIPGKNLRLLNGKPLISYAIDAAKASKYINRIIVSTDDNKIKEAALSLGTEVHDRPSNLAQDKSLVIDSIRSLVESIEQNESSHIDIIVVLECTSPIKSVIDIDRGIDQVMNYGFDSATSLTETAISPNRMWIISDNTLSSFIKGAKPFLPRQEQPKAFQLTGQFYVLSKKILNDNPDSISLLLGKVYPLISTSKAFFDIDEEMDLFIAEQYLKNYENN